MRTYRIFILMCTFLLIFSLLLGKIFYYQIVCGEKITKAATTMRSKQITLKEYSRGSILDRNSLPLTDNSFTQALYGLPFEIARVNQNGDKINKPEIFNHLADELKEQGISLDKEAVVTNLTEAMEKGNPIVRVANNLTSTDIDKLNSSNLSGVVTAPLIKRYDGYCSHIVGYVKGVNDNEGVVGIEKQYNQFLGGNSKSPELVSVLDARGRAIQGLMFKIRENENYKQGSVVLTIDKRIQQIVEESMDKRIIKGAVVVMDIKSKEILAIASRPNFNPYDLPRVINDSIDSPLTNRALSRFHPGSLFKILVAAAALEEKIVSVDDTFYCEGSYKFTDNLSISCWHEKGHGSINFVKAFANSCNPTFIEVGLKLKREKLQEYAAKLHVTDDTINGWLETSPRKSYVDISPGPAGIGNACLGQQGVMLTPVQLANLIATIANNGKWGTPSIVKYTMDAEGHRHLPPATLFEQVISVDTAQKVQMLMEEVVTGGTGKTASLTSVRVAGKTATSQTGNYTENEEEILNTWFGGYFPADNPKWSIVVMAEEGTSGAVDAAPVFKDIASGILELFSAID